MNSNLFHNLANVAQALIGLITSVLVFVGCKADAITGALDCSQVNQKYVVYATAAVGVISVLKVAVNIGRDGVSGLTKPQPPVQK